MPSDERSTRALQALRASRTAFHSAVAGAVDQIRAYLEAERPPTSDRAQRTATELGAFAAARIDAERFAALFEAHEPLQPELYSRVERALGVLTHAAEAGDGLFRVEVEPGADLRDTVAWGLAVAGRVFAAAQTVELIRRGRYRPEQDRHPPEVFPFLDTFPFRRWNRAERQIAPPLVVEVDGADLRAGGLAEFLDGAQKLVLVVRGACPPAPLVRLITPGVLVAQTAEPDELERLCGTAGPAVVALVPESAARFVHHPAGGPALRDRLAVQHLPAGESGERSGPGAGFPELEELRQLRVLAAAAAVPPVAEPAPASAAPASAAPAAESAPADRLAAWLLQQADLQDPA